MHIKFSQGQHGSKGSLIRGRQFKKWLPEVRFNKCWGGTMNKMIDDAIKHLQKVGKRARRGVS